VRTFAKSYRQVIGVAIIASGHVGTLRGEVAPGPPGSASPRTIPAGPARVGPNIRAAFVAHGERATLVGRQHN
jgi:hypothetical protein